MRQLNPYSLSYQPNTLIRSPDEETMVNNESKYTDGRRILDNPQIKLIVSPTHRTELYSEDIEYKVKNHIREKLIPLLRTMYEISPGFGLEIYFGSERSETILEHLD